MIEKKIVKHYGKHVLTALEISEMTQTLVRAQLELPRLEDHKKIWRLNYE